MGKKSPAQAAVAEAIALRLFPPSLRYPEVGTGLLLSEWFCYPTLTWAPECLEPNRRPKCVIEGCCCVPKVKEYKERLVEDVDHRTVLYYARYQCAGTAKKSFSTISDAYLASSKTFVLHFSYLLTYKSGISTDMFDIVYDSMLTTKGFAGAVANISRRRQRRYYRILSRVGASVEKLRLENADYAPPLPPTEAQYIANNLCIDAEVLKELWLTHTNIYSRLCVAQMLDTKCNRVFRIDHSQKFCSKLKVYGENGSKEQSTSIRMLLLVQNEVGQIMGRSLTQSENHAETEVLLQSMVKKMGSGSDRPRICVCDNVNTTRNLIARVFGGAVEIKQDPFHVITRLTEKISDSAKKKWLAGQLSAAIYDLQRNLRPPAQCEELFKAAVESLDLASIRVKRSEWEGCVESNLAQIRRGDLYVVENQYTEKGGEVRVVSTSQLEAIHSKLRKLLDRVLSVEVGMRILDIFILQHNLNVGAKHRRNPMFYGTDFRSVCQSALICAGSLPDTPQLEYMRMLLSRSSKTDLTTIEYRLGSAAAPQHRPWERLFDIIRLDTTQIESRLLRQHEVAGDIRELLLNAHKARKSTSSKVFVELLGLEPEYESSTEFTAREFSLLKELRAEQLAANKPWSTSDVIATIVYNAAVQQLDNPALGVKKRGFRAIARRIGGVDDQLMIKPVCPGRRIIHAVDKAVNDDAVSPDEEALMKNLYAMVRTAGLKKRKQTYFMVYNFAASMCSGIEPKSEGLLQRRWEGMKRSENRHKKKKAEDCVKSQNDTLCIHTTGVTSPQLVRNSHEATSKRRATILSAQQSVQATAAFADAEDSHKAAKPALNEEAVAFTAQAMPDLNHQQHATTRASVQEESTIIPVFNSPGTAMRILPLSGTLDPAPVLDESTAEHLLNIADKFPRHTQGKWPSLLEEFQRLKPHSTISQNALRKRLEKYYQKKKQTLTTTSVIQQSASGANLHPTHTEASSNADELETKRPAPACKSCRERKRKCGPSSINPHCERRKKSRQDTISSFFS